MKPYRGTLVTAAVFLVILPLFGCGHDLNGGSGSLLQVESISPSNFEPDLFRTLCEVDDTGKPSYEVNAVTNHYATVSILNDSLPTTPTGESTNSHVTLNNYRVSFTGISRDVNIPDIFEGGWTVGIAPGSTATMPILVLDLNTQDYIRARYPSVGRSESLTLRATFTIWGEDSFHVKISAVGQVVLVIDDYTTCK